MNPLISHRCGAHISFELCSIDKHKRGACVKTSVMLASRQLLTVHKTSSSAEPLLARWPQSRTKCLQIDREHDFMFRFGRVWSLEMHLHLVPSFHCLLHTRNMPLYLFYFFYEMASRENIQDCHFNRMVKGRWAWTVASGSTSRNNRGIRLSASCCLSYVALLISESGDCPKGFTFHHHLLHTHSS